MNRSRRLSTALVTFVAFGSLFGVGAATALKGNHYPVGCLRQYDVNIGYYPALVARATALRIEPRDDAQTIRTLEVGRRFGIQSVPNPDRLADPGKRAPVNGYVWGYSKTGGHSGWIKLDALTPDLHGKWADGPNHEDFEAGGIGVPDLRTAPRFTTGYAAKGTATIVPHTAYLRWAPKSAALAILTEGTTINLLWRSSGHVCVEVDGQRGWVHVDNTSLG